MAASGEKPYRVYRGGRTKGKVPVSSRDRDRSKRDRSTYRGGGGGGRDGSGKQVVRRPRKGWTWKRWTWVTLVVLVAFLVVWGVAGYFSVRSGVTAANERLPVGTDTALAPQNALLLSTGTNILLLGTDHSTNGQAGRSADQHSDSMMLMHTDPGRHRLVYLSIPRDLRAAIPGYGEQKINAAMQLGGPKLAIKTADALFGPELQVNHVVVVDMAAFQQLIDAVGGIDINVPQNILSNRFDCPYASSTRCSQWEGWRFHKGTQHMDGHRALIYSRIRENRLNPADTDISRGQRQQDVMQATLRKLASAEHVLPAAVQRRRSVEAARDRHVDVAVHAARLGEVPRRLDAALPARRQGLRRRVHHGRPGEHRGHPDGARQVRGAAAAARLRLVRRRLPARLAQRRIRSRGFLRARP